MEQRMQEVLSCNNAHEVTFGEVPGFGYGEGSISRKKQLESGELTEEKETIGLSYIVNTETAFVPVDKSDDGCGDGRGTEEVYRFDVSGNKITYDYSLHRAKVFGGGLMMTNAALIGIGSIAANSGEQLKSALSYLQAAGVEFGAHTDTHAHGDNSGCGAIDKYPAILTNAIKYSFEIQKSIATLLGANHSESLFSEVAENFADALKNTDGSLYAGKDTEELVESKGAVIKKLRGNHQEDFVVLNFVDGTTLNQTGLINETEGGAQAFCVDVWRLQTYAKAVATTEQKQTAALYGMLIYTLATSATLTDGSLRVLVRN
jgi:hypothetical protein